MPDFSKMPVLHVTAHNHEWVAKNSGLSVDEVRRRYDEDTAKGIVCVIEANTRDIKA